MRRALAAPARGRYHGGLMPRTMIRAYGLRALLAAHPEVRKLKRTASPSIHGNKSWPSSWLLVDYLSRKPIAKRRRVLELGAGWGLTGIYCARQFDSRVTAVDKDPEVFEYLRVQARINGVRIRELPLGFASIGRQHLEKADVLIGTDICFWDSMIGPLRTVINKALDSGVRLVLIADPGRSPFDKLAKGFVRAGRGELIDWTAKKPRSRWGQILRIEG
jgi:predicted nicotinamide N-methyase